MKENQNLDFKKIWKDEFPEYVADSQIRREGRCS